MSDKRPVRIFAPGAFSYSNKGDAALVIAFRSWLNLAFSDLALTLTSFSPCSDQLHYEVPVLDMAVRPRSRMKKVLHRLSVNSPSLGLIVSCWMYLYVVGVCWVLAGWTKLYFRAPALARAVAPDHIVSLSQAIQSADLVVTVPGGFLLAPRRLDHWWLFHLPTFALAWALGKDVILGPCSIGPFDRVYRGFARRTLRRCRLIYVRETWSEDYLLHLGVDRDRIVFCPDLAFLLHNDPEQSEERRNSSRQLNVARGWILETTRPILGVSVRDHSFPSVGDPKNRRSLYFRAVSNAADYIVHRYNARVLVVPQTLEDLAAGRLVYTEMNHKGDVAVVEDDLSPHQLQELYAGCHLLIGTRMHANILAMCVNTPVVAIGYQPKTQGIMSALGLQDWVLPIDDMTGFDTTTRRAWDAAEDLRKILPHKIEAMRVRIDASASELHAAFERINNE